MWERRRTVRYRCSRPLIIRSAGRETVGVSWDISTTGLCMGSFLPLRAGEHVTVSVRTTDGAPPWFELRGRVVRTAVDSEGYPWSYRVGVQLDAPMHMLPELLALEAVAGGGGGSPQASASAA